MVASLGKAGMTEKELSEAFDGANRKALYLSADSTPAFADSTKGLTDSVAVEYLFQRLEPTDLPVAFDVDLRRVIEIRLRNDQSREAYKRALEEASVEGRKTVAKLLGVWLVPIALLGVIGWLVGWVIRGFRKEPTTPTGTGKPVA